jgi:hypothetical protein
MFIRLKHLLAMALLFNSVLSAPINVKLLQKTITSSTKPTSSTRHKSNPTLNPTKSPSSSSKESVKPASQSTKVSQKHSITSSKSSKSSRTSTAKPFSASSKPHSQKNSSTKKSINPTATTRSNALIDPSVYGNPNSHGYIVQVPNQSPQKVKGKVVNKPKTVFGNTTDAAAQAAVNSLIKMFKNASYNGCFANRELEKFPSKSFAALWLRSMVHCYFIFIWKCTRD